ncbi:MAG TPA: glycosyltransferase, partial [Desulfobacteraceae bacterium]|nr:glycosyltransferase [Desulfobacteraceae bacterium]
MRVLHIGKYYPPFEGGIENFLGDLLPVLKNKGLDVAAVVHDHSFRLKGYYGEKQSFDVYRVPTLGTFMYAPVSPGFPFVLRRVISRFKPDLLHIHMPNTSAFWVMALSCARRIPWIIHWHSDVVPSLIDQRMTFFYSLYKPLERCLLKHSSVIISTSAPYLNSSKALSAWRNKCRVIELGMDPGRLKLPGKQLISWAEGMWKEKMIRVLAIGRLTYYKGHDILIKAASKTPEISVIIVGKGDRKKELEAHISELAIGERVKLPGSLSGDRLHALLASCDFLCLPSVERTEAFGLVLLEAMRFGKPVVASDIRGS